MPKGNGNGLAVRVYLRSMQSTDLNVLIALDVLLREESVSIAARKMGLSAPAMSRTLDRARQLIGDPILVRAGKRLVPTRRAQELRARIEALADEARSIVSANSGVGNNSTERIFTIRTDVSLGAEFAAPIMEALGATAPRMRLRFVGQTEHSVEALRDGSVDLDIDDKFPGPELKVQLLRKVMFVGAVRKGHPLLSSRVTAKSFAEGQHVAGGWRSKMRGPIDLELEKLGLSRRVALWVPSFLPAMVSASASDMIASIPEFFTPLAADLFGLQIFRIPLQLPPLTLSLIWHPRSDSDPAHRLLRESVRLAFRRVTGSTSVIVPERGQDSHGGS